MGHLAGRSWLGLAENALGEQFYYSKRIYFQTNPDIGSFSTSVVTVRDRLASCDWALGFDLNVKLTATKEIRVDGICHGRQVVVANSASSFN